MASSRRLVHFACTLVVLVPLAPLSLARAAEPAKSRAGNAPAIARAPVEAPAGERIVGVPIRPVSSGVVNMMEAARRDALVPASQRPPVRPLVRAEANENDAESAGVEERNASRAAGQPV